MQPGVFVPSPLIEIAKQPICVCLCRPPPGTPRLPDLAYGVDSTYHLRVLQEQQPDEGSGVSGGLYAWKIVAAPADTLFICVQVTFDRKEPTVPQLYCLDNQGCLHIRGDDGKTWNKFPNTQGLSWIAISPLKPEGCYLPYLWGIQLQQQGRLFRYHNPDYHKKEVMEELASMARHRFERSDARESVLDLQETPARWIVEQGGTAMSVSVNSSNVCVVAQMGTGVVYRYVPANSQQDIFHAASWQQVGASPFSAQSVFVSEEGLVLAVSSKDGTLWQFALTVQGANWQKIPFVAGDGNAQWTRAEAMGRGAETMLAIAASKAVYYRAPTNPKIVPAKPGAAGIAIPPGVPRRGSSSSVSSSSSTESAPAAQGHEGGKIFTVQYKHEADLKLFKVDYQHEADMKVYKVEYNHEATKDHFWYDVQYQHEADKKIIWVDYQHEADLKVYYVDYRHEATGRWPD